MSYIPCARDITITYCPVTTNQIAHTIVVIQYTIIIYRAVMCTYIPLLLSLQPSLEGRSIQAAPYHQGYQEDQVVLLALEVPMHAHKKLKLITEYFSLFVPC